MLSADELVAFTVEQIALDGVEGCSITRLWEIVQLKVENLDDSLKYVVWKWLCQQNDQFIVGLNNADGEDPKPLDTDEEDMTDLASLLEKHGEQLRVFVSQDLLWRTLTGAPKEGSSLGHYPFVLLCTITRAREAGITAIDVARVTNQDPRSLFSRVNVLSNLGLIRKYPVVVKKGGKTTLLISTRFARADPVSRNENASAGTETVKLRREIMEYLKVAKNGLRQRADLRKQLGMDTSRYKIKVFGRCVENLESKGYIRKVFVVRASDESGKKHSCLQFVKEYPEKEVFREEEIEFQEVAEEAAENEGEKSSDVEDASQEPFEVSENDKIQEFQEESEQSPRFNRFFPLENQVYDLVASKRTKGISSMELTRKCVGRDFSRIFNTVLTKFADTSGPDGSKSSQPRHLSQYAMVRGSDNTARVSYYRYFTLPAYRTFVQKSPDVDWGKFGPLISKSVYADLQLLSKRPNRLRYVPEIGIGMDDEGEKIPAWHGTGNSITRLNIKEVVTPARSEPDVTDQPIRKRGRPRKDPRSELSVPLATPVIEDAALETEPQGQISETPVAPPEVEKEQASEKTPEGDVVMTEGPKDDAAAATASSMSSSSKPIKKTSIATLKKSEPVKPGARSSSSGVSSFSIAASLRQSLMLQLLEEGGGVMEGGTPLLANLRDRSQNSTSGQLDRRTLERDTNSLVNKNKLQRICISTIDGQGRPTTTWILTYPHYGVDSPEVVKFKENLMVSKDGTKRANRAIEVISNEFSFYNMVPIQSMKQRARVQRRAEKALRTTKLSTEQQQAASARLKKRMEEQEGSGHGLSLLTVGEHGISQRRRRPKVSAPPLQRRKENPSVVEPCTANAAESPEAVIARPSGKARRKRGTVEAAVDPISEFVRPGKKAKSMEALETRQKRAELIKEHKKNSRRIRNTTRLGHKHADCIFRAVIITRSFYGGLAKAIAWDRVAAALGEPYTVDTLQSVWPRIRQFFGGSKALIRAAERWEHVFLDAYENDKLINLDFEYLDIMALVKYWRENDTDMVDDEDSVGLLESIMKDNALRDYTFVRDEPSSLWLDDVYISVSTVKSEESLTSVPFACRREEPLLPELHAPKRADDVKQLIKAIIATDESKYDPQSAKVLLDKFGTQRCSEAVNQMEKEKILVYTSRDLDKRVPGRNFVFSDRFNMMAKLRTEESSFNKACSFHNRLLSTFAQSKGIIMSRLAPDSSMICLMDLIAQGEVELVRVNVSAGKLIEGYTSRLVDRDKLDCDIVIRSSADRQVPSLPSVEVPVPAVHADPSEGAKFLVPGGRMWIDVLGDINKVWFLRLVNVVLMTIALRPGVPAAELCRKFHCMLTEAEMKDILEWIVQKDLVEFVGEKSNGYWVKQGWYHSEIYD
ncbi:uncharacterized protein V1513DRAFT_463334 [Lipomyces chichibuensis]|uniref:uncharacterized protein n=1 Tax=Lipomyces chichibuensis TaxID=1546026 RepID=UPI0033442073